jgi:type II secretion system protein D
MEQQVNIVADTDSRKVILQASPRYFANVRRIIEELDEAPSQVMIQAMIAEVTLDGRIEYGFEAVGQDLSFTKAQTAPGIGPGHDVVVGTDVGAAGGAGPAGFVFSLHGEDFNLLLRAFNSDGKLQVLCRPQIMARDNAEANIQIGQRVPFPTGSNISPDTGNITTTIQYEDVGVILKVTPHINPEGYVNLEVEPEISSISTSNVQISQGLSAPIFNKNSAKTIVTIKDGETVVIGGLITKRKDHRENKVPFLGDIPLLGLAFKSITDTETRSELLIILTPKLVDTVDKARAISVEERDILELVPKEIRESRLMGKLRQEFDEEGFPITTQPACTQPASLEPGEEGEVIEVETGEHLFKKPVCNEQLLNAFKRTCDQ